MLHSSAGAGAESATRPYDILPVPIEALGKLLDHPTAYKKPRLIKVKVKLSLLSEAYRISVRSHELPKVKRA